MFWFVTWNAGTERHCQMFHTPDQVWEWVEEFRSKTGSLPSSFAVYKGECIADLS